MFQKTAKQKYFELLREKYPSEQTVFTEIINLQAILNLPKGTEHFISDIHGEYEAFTHIMNNCSGVISEKIRLVLGGLLSPGEQSLLCSLIYYPKEKLALLREQNALTRAWYLESLQQLVSLARHLSSKYTRSKVRKALPKVFSYIIDELLHTHPQEDANRQSYHRKIMESILETGSADDFIIALCALIKRLAVDHLHIVGDIFDRGAHADYVMDILMAHHSVDIEWGNHDILWMGAALGSEACIMAVLRNNITGGNMEILENGYGISLRSLALFAQKHFKGDALKKAAAVILFKLEGQLIKRHPEYDMADRLLLDKINQDAGTVLINGQPYPLRDNDFPTLQPEDAYALTREENEIVAELRHAFLSSERLQKHVAFLFEKGAIYKCHNGNLLFHGCVPLNEAGQFASAAFEGAAYSGKAYLDYAEQVARRCFAHPVQNDLDFMWYLWCGKKSPLSGRVVKTFERTFVADEALFHEPRDPYFDHCSREEICGMVLKEFGLLGASAHIINGHTPVRVVQGESPIKAGGKLIVIDGGFCKAYQATTGIAGYTLIYNSYGLRITSHMPFPGLFRALRENVDVESHSVFFEAEPVRLRIADTDTGASIQESLQDLSYLLTQYRKRQVDSADFSG